MTLKPFAVIVILTLLLAACGIVPATTPAAPQAVETAIPSPAKQSSLPPPTTAAPLKRYTDTPSPIGITTAPPQIHRDLQIYDVTFSLNKLCDSQYGLSISPDKTWLLINCEYKKHITLEIVSSNEQHWRLNFEDFKPREISGSGGGFFPLSWSPDNKYLYLGSQVGWSGGGICDYRYNRYQGLYRININNGSVAIILPTLASFEPYEIAFSPTGRLFIDQDLIIPQSLTCKPEKKFPSKLAKDMHQAILFGHQMGKKLPTPFALEC